MESEDYLTVTTISIPQQAYRQRFNPYNPSNEPCMTWLNAQQPSSVVYIAFGTVATLSEHQITELAQALMHFQCKFMWAIRDIEQNKLPKDL